MRFGVAVVLAVIVWASPASALGKNRCYEAARAFVVPLLTGDFEDMPPTEVEKPGGWAAWLEAQVAAPGGFSAFSIVTQVREGDGCRTSIRVRKSDGNTYAMLAWFGSDGRLTSVTSLREAIDVRQQELEETLAEIDEALPVVRDDSADDRTVLPLLRRLSRTARRARRDIDEYIFALEDPPP